MGYMHIDNLYRPSAQNILQFKQLYALEKIHGTSAHISFRDGQLTFFSGGESYDRFVALFDQPALLKTFDEKFGGQAIEMTIYGEAYGGKQQGMSATYGPDLKFVAFDVKLNGSWLAVDSAARLVTQFGLEFVDYVQIPASLEAIDAERDKPSTQAIRNGMGTDKLREGVVLRPPFEVTINNGERVIAKHKRDEFRETKTARVVQRESVLKFKDVAEEFVTAQRMEHVIGQLVAGRDNKQIGMEDTGDLIKLMCADVLREGSGEFIVEDQKSFNKSIGAVVVRLLKARLEQDMRAKV